MPETPIRDLAPGCRMTPFQAPVDHDALTTLLMTDECRQILIGDITSAFGRDAGLLLLDRLVDERVLAPNHFGLSPRDPRVQPAAWC